MISELFRLLESCQQGYLQIVVLVLCLRLSSIFFARFFLFPQLFGAQSPGVA